MPWSEFFRGQLHRALLRWFVVRATLVAIAFWTVFLLLAQWLAAYGLLAIWYVLATAWLILAMPILVIQLQLISDVMMYAMTGRTAFFRALMIDQVDQKGNDAFNQLSPREQRVILFCARVGVHVGDTSPLSGVALWALTVLVRMPKAAHERVPATRSDLLEIVRIGREIKERIVSDVVCRTLALTG